MYEVEKSAIVEALDYADFEDPEDAARWDYSGRGMYGRSCFGIIGTMEDYSNFLLGLVGVFYDQTEDIDQAQYLAGLFGSTVRTDSMAYDTIYYFPSIKVLDNK